MCDLAQKKRIVIVGCCGSGKSTLARALGKKTGLPVVHLDTLFWLPDWEKRPRDDFLGLHNVAIQQERWIMDGNQTRCLLPRAERADCMIILDYPLHLCLYRIFKRLWMYMGRTRPDLASGCPEQVSLEFLLYVLRFRKNTFPRIKAAREVLEAAGKSVLIFKTPQATKAWLERIST